MSRVHMFVYNGWNTSLGRYYGNQIYQGKHKKHAREHFITHKIRIMIISINWNNVVIHTYDSPIQLCYRTMMQKSRHLNWCSWWVTDTSFLIFQLIDCHIFFTVSVISLFISDNVAMGDILWIFTRYDILCIIFL